MRSDNRAIAILLGVLLLILIASPMLMSGMMGPGMMWGWAQGGNAPASGWSWGLAMALGWLAMLAFWGAIIVGGVLLVRWLIGPSSAPVNGHRDEQAPEARNVDSLLRPVRGAGAYVPRSSPLSA